MSSSFYYQKGRMWPSSRLIPKRQGVAVHTLILLCYGILSFIVERQEGAILSLPLKKQLVAIHPLILLLGDILPCLLERQVVSSSPSF